MQLQLLKPADVVEIHDRVLNPGELEGMAGGKSLEGALSRIEFRMQYGMIDDVFDLAAVYVVAISQAHAFNDANKRTAFACMDTSLALNGIELNYKPAEAGDQIIRAAQGVVDETELAAWLRGLEYLGSE